MVKKTETIPALMRSHSSRIPSFERFGKGQTALDSPLPLPHTYHKENHRATIEVCKQIWIFRFDNGQHLRDGVGVGSEAGDG